MGLRHRSRSGVSLREVHLSCDRLATSRDDPCLVESHSTFKGGLNFQNFIPKYSTSDYSCLRRALISFPIQFGIPLLQKIRQSCYSTDEIDVRSANRK